MQDMQILSSEGHLPGLPLQGDDRLKTIVSEGARARVALGYYGLGFQPSFLPMIAKQSCGHGSRHAGAF